MDGVGNSEAGGETLLLVEDEEMVREFAYRILVAQGYRVLVAGHGKEALTVASGHDGPIHLVVTDVLMPRMSAMEFAQRIRSDRPDIKILFVSGHTREEMVRLGMLTLDSPFLGKPYTAASFRQRIRDMLDTPATDAGESAPNE
jgi:two-component system, cell cycle sensor histidine kinase and response regulator CckA